MAQGGYALLVVMMLATVLMVSLTAALPNIYLQGQREREEELIFRGRQYARAIALFRQQFNRYPSSVKDLLHTNQMSFLRKAYRDPMSKSGNWRFIHATASGVILDSKILGSPGQSNPAGGGNSQGNQMPPGNANSATPPGQNTPGGEGFSLFGGQGTGSSFGPSGQNTGSGFASSSQPSGPGSSATPGPSIFGNNNQLLGAYIVGVASTSKKTSIRVFEGRTHYDEWEFLGVPGAPGGLSIGGGGGAQGLQGGPMSPSGQTPQGNPNPNPQPNSVFGGASMPQ